MINAGENVVKILFVTISGDCSAKPSWITWERVTWGFLNRFLLANNRISALRSALRRAGPILMGCRDLLDSWKLNLSKFRAFRAGVGSSAAEGDSPGVRGWLSGLREGGITRSHGSENSPGSQTGRLQKSSSSIFLRERVENMHRFPFPHALLGENPAPGQRNEHPNGAMAQAEPGQTETCLGSQPGLPGGCRCPSQGRWAPRGCGRWQSGRHGAPCEPSRRGGVSALGMV